MVSLDLESAQPERDLLIAEAFEAGCAGITELSDLRVRVFFESEPDAQRFQAKFGGAVELAEERDWVSDAQQGWEPQLVGERFFLAPQWRDDPTPTGRFRIVVNNGLAFGTGKHETTRLCLTLLETWVKPGMTVVDIGTGSGILAEAALHLGAAMVYGCDIDYTAVEIAKANGIVAFTGSAEAIRSGVADLVVANISPETITALAGEIPRLLRAGGTAILSGLENHDEVPFRPAEVHSEGNWRALVVSY